MATSREFREEPPGAAFQAIRLTLPTAVAGIGIANYGGVPTEVQAVALAVAGVALILRGAALLRNWRGVFDALLRREQRSWRGSLGINETVSRRGALAVIGIGIVCLASVALV